MYVKIHSEKGTKNKGSSAYLVDYLEKENLNKDLLSQEMFFDQNREDVSGYTVCNKIDYNKSKLGKDQAKFYMISVNPSKEEQQYICRVITGGRDVREPSQLTASEMKKFEVALKDYARGIMDDYAKNFNKGLDGNSLLYFGKVEHNRYYGNDSKEVKNGLKNIGERKEGFQAHVHIIVSRKDIGNKMKLSPMAIARSAKSNLNQSQFGFDRIKFVKTCEERFDKTFGYNREQYQTFEHRHAMKNQMGNVAKATLKGAVLSATREVPGASEMNRFTGLIYTANTLAKSKDPLEALQMAFRQIPGASECVKAIGYVYNPQKIVLDIGKKILSAGINSGM